MSIRIIISLLLTILVIGSQSSALLQTSASHNGGSSTINTERSYETATNLMRFGTVNGTYEYGGASTSIVTLGRTGYQHNSDSGYGIISEASIETTGMLNAWDSSGQFSTQSYQPETPCESGNIEGNVTGEQNESSERFPETSTAEASMMATGTNGLSEYKSATVVSGKTLALSASLTGKQSSLIGDLKASTKRGFNSSEGTQNFDYSAHDHLIGYSDPLEGQNTQFDFVWNAGTLDEEIVNNTTSEEVSS